MIRRENVIKRFIMGMSVLTAYIYYTGNLNMHDINISAEQFMCDLLNILYNMDLKNANNVTYNNSGYDLISENKKIIIQVTVTDTPEKIIRTLNTIKHKVFEYSEWTEKLREIRVQKKLDPSTYTSKVQDDEKKIRSKLAENVNLNDYTFNKFPQLFHGSIFGPDFHLPFSFLYILFRFIKIIFCFFHTSFTEIPNFRHISAVSCYL